MALSNFSRFGASDLNPIKTLEVYGNFLIKTSSLEVELDLDVTYADFLQGSWQIAVKEILYECYNGQKSESTTSRFFNVKTNFVFGQYTQNFQRKPVPLARFTVKETEKDLVYMSPLVWFDVNSPSRCLKLSLDIIDMWDVGIIPKFQSGFNFFVILLFRRIL